MRLASTGTYDRGRTVRASRLTAASVGVASMLLYCLTVEPTASYWDCPEYIAVGSRLEVGHPPGNPTWALMARMASMLAPSAGKVALAVNLTSGLFTALAAALLSLTASRMVMYLARGRRQGRRWPASAAPLAGGVAGCVFAVCDSVWFSAVEAEVYAFSIFCTALMMWLAVCVAGMADAARRGRYVVLLAYVTGLSIGVHQLSMLCLPAAALAMRFGGRGRPGAARSWGVFVAGGAVVGCILLGLMPGALAMACALELTCVNTLGLPFHSGAVAWCVLWICAMAGAIAAVGRGAPRWLSFTLATLALWLCGILSAGGDIWLGLVLSASVAAVMLYGVSNRRRLELALWCAGFVTLGYCTYGIVLIRSAAAPPLNEGAPSDVFALSSYLRRDQYGSKPLLRGRTPYSEMLRAERVTPSGADYSAVYREPGAVRYVRAVPGTVAAGRGALLTAADSALNRRALERAAAGHDAYMAGSRASVYRFAPELDMWLPRMTGGSQFDLDSYESWVGMTPATMVAVEASAAVDSAGRAVGRLRPGGDREGRHTYRPTYAQNFAFMGAYQAGYMYFRYLLWNFLGRQNDRHSQGEADNGNFITGVDALDDAMLGAQGLRPAGEWSANPGHHVYWFLPLLLGLAGAVCLLCSGRRGRRVCAVVAALFVMTGLAIVVYLNQGPGEPRERDYSFAGSFYAYALWCGLGAAYAVRGASAAAGRRGRVARTAAQVAAGAACMAVPALMLAENYPDHDRSGRTATVDFAANILLPLEPGAIIFVNGDNYTFPLWYAQEVEGMRRDVRVVNVAYLSTPWYPASLLTQAWESAPVPMTATAPALGCGAYALVHVPAAGDAPASDACAELRRLYAGVPPGVSPRFAASRLRVAGVAGGDSLTLDLRRMLPGGKRYMTQDQLLTLDIVATNAASERPRPVYWLDVTSRRNAAGWLPYTERRGMSLLYTGRPTADGQPAANPEATYAQARGLFRWGGLDRGDDVYVDHTTGMHVSLLRKTLLLAAMGLADSARWEEALDMARLIETRLPARLHPYGIVTDRYVPLHEGAELGELYVRAGRATGRPDLSRHGLRLIAAEIRRAAMVRRWWRALTPAQRAVNSPATRTDAADFYAPVDTWLRCGGDTAALRRMTPLAEVLEAGSRRDWLRADALRRLLRDVRHGSPDSLTAVHLAVFRANGGRDADLSAYREFDTYDFTHLLPPGGEASPAER